MNPIPLNTPSQILENPPTAKKAKLDTLDTIGSLASKNISIIQFEPKMNDGEPVQNSPVQYIGEIKDGKPNGFGKMTFLSGLMIEANFVEGKILDIPFKTVYPDKRIYKGKMQDGFPAGKGELLYPDGTRFEGYFIPHETIAGGTLYSPMGWIYNGEVLNDRPHGQGILKLQNGDIHICRWINGVANGPAEVHYPDGTVMKCTYINQKMTGEISYTYPGGEMIQCVRGLTSKIYDKGTTYTYKV